MATDPFAFESEFTFVGYSDPNLEEIEPIQLKDHIRGIVDNMRSVLDLHTGINKFTSYTEFDNVRYKVHLLRE